MSEQQTAGAFDIRNMIGIVIGIFGVILVIVGLFFSPADELAKSGGIRANLIAGICMVVVALIFIAWSRLRPIVVATGDADAEAPTRPTEG